MDRRTFIGAFAGGLLAAPMAAQAQPQTKAFRIGILSGSSVTSPEAVHIWDGFSRGCASSDTSRAETSSSRADITAIASNGFPPSRPSSFGFRSM